MIPGRAAAALLLGAGVALLLPWDRIDPVVSRLFYRPEFPQGPWQPAAEVPWGLLARMTTWVAVALALTGIALLAASLRGRGGPAAPASGAESPRRSARRALVILLGLALGPGLLVNVLLKDHCHRPRPRQTVGLGGDFHYVAPFRVGPVGKSFPCGHSAVGFACIALAGVVNERRRGARVAVASGALALGALLGLGRIATGAHFASDVIWSGLLTCGTVLVISWSLEFAERRRALLAAPAPDGAQRSRRVRAGRLVLAGSLVAVAALASALLCFPFRHVAAAHPFPLPAGPATTLEARIEVGHARLVIGPPGEAVLTVETRHDGFGVPWGRIDESMQPASGEQAAGLAWPNRAAVRYRLAPRGWFADLEGTTTLRLPAGTVGRVEIAVADGHLTLDDESSGGALPAIVCRIRRDALRLRGDLRRDQIEVIER